MGRKIITMFRFVIYKIDNDNECRMVSSKTIRETQMKFCKDLKYGLDLKNL